ncbi:chymotrypsin-1-like [Contarinia nasturtii]|uniref:chymotrypsin-1-like n=1 Tax=Contarinia nasturtii TaxID=265458 RepID=UPI0012D48722|nr:chymotrypsin-1-like [Contarinia nasturtii]
MKLKLFVLFCVVGVISARISLRSEIGYPPLSSRIVGGTNATDGQAPYQCSMQQNGRHFCGCVIVGDQWILSAAHCLAIGIQGVQILAGTNDVKSGGVRYTPEKYIIHEKFNQPSFANDIGLIKVNKIYFNEKVQPIKYSSNFVNAGSVLLATGWGRLSAWGDAPQLLQVIKLTAISNDECEAIHGDIVAPSHLCTYTKVGEGVCSGDSGGPLVLGDEVVGLANWAVLCALGYPDGFARISYLYDWIQKNIATL